MSMTNEYRIKYIFKSLHTTVTALHVYELEYAACLVFVMFSDLCASVSMYYNLKARFSNEDNTNED